MEDLYFSFIIPVYNRPQEVAELLQSFRQQTYDGEYEIVIVEDGSDVTAETVLKDFSDLALTYLKKQNTGPGPSRNYGMQRAKGMYFIILDSDCILPPEYLNIVNDHLKEDYFDFYGGPDAAHPDFDNRQKAVSFAMTSVLTTGGLRGKGADSKKFQPRSFNMGISKSAFEASGGFGNIHPGEDPDLTFRLWERGFSSTLIEEAFVYHKRRITWKGFYKQVNKFGKVRPILNKWHPGTAKLTYWFPTLFTGFVLCAIIMACFGIFTPIAALVFYIVSVALFASIICESVAVGLLSILALLVQFFGYGVGFFESILKIKILGREERKVFPKLFFD
ncbi:MAG: glycosyltransferase [Leeuwenhoekiella sp.]